MSVVAARVESKMATTQARMEPVSKKQTVATSSGAWLGST